MAGDELLRQLAAVLRKQLREHDMLARLGGDEFAVLLSNCTHDQATRASEKVRSAVAAFVFAWEGEEFSIGASIGRVDFCDGSMSVSELLMRADEMCYLAKTSGRNQIKTYQPPSDMGAINGAGKHAFGGARSGERSPLARISDRMRAQPAAGSLSVIGGVPIARRCRPPES